MGHDTNPEKKDYTPILPFDVTVGEDYSMYDNTVYHRDITLFDQNERMMNRGNTISVLNYKMGAPRKIGGDPVEEKEEENMEEDSGDSSIF